MPEPRGSDMASSVVDLTKSDDDVVELSSRSLPEGLKRTKKKKKHHFPRDILNPEGASSDYRILKGRSSTVIEVSSGDDEALQGGTASRRVNLQRESKSPAGVRDNIPSGLDAKTTATQAGPSTSRKPIDGGGQSQPGGRPTPDPASSMANNSASDPPPVRPGSTEDISENPVLKSLFTSPLQTAQPIGKRRLASPELGERTQTTTNSREEGATTTKLTEVANCVLDEREIEQTNLDVGGATEGTNELNNMRPKKGMGSSASSLQVEDPPSKPKAKEHLAKTARPVKSQATFPIRRAPRQSEESTHRSRNGSRSGSHESEPPKEPGKEIARLRTSRSPLKNVSSISVATSDPTGNMDETMGSSPKAPEDHPEPPLTEGMTAEDTHFDLRSMKSHHMARIYIFNQNGNC